MRFKLKRFFKIYFPSILGAVVYGYIAITLPEEIPAIRLSGFFTGIVLIRFTEKVLNRID